MDPDAWLVTVGDGIMEACAVLWMFKHLPLRDWLAYSEKFGMPYLLGKTGAAFNSAEWNAMAAALRGFGSDGAAVVGGADDIVPVQAGAGSEDTPFQGLVERSDRAMSILWRGADLGTQSHGTSGGGQGASLQADETAALDEDRAAWLTESLRPVSRTAIRYLFGPEARPLAYVRIRTLVRRDIQLDLAVDSFLLNNGAPVARADALERYGRPTPGADEPLLQPPAAAGGSARNAASEDASLSLHRTLRQRPPARPGRERGVSRRRARSQLVGAANDVAAIAPAAGDAIGHADRWFQVSPFGRFPHRVGMQVFDRQAANAIVTLFNSARDRLARLWRGLPVFIGHPDLDPKTYPDHRKYGSIQRLEVRADGLYAQAKWSRAGREIVNDEHFDFPSPLWNMEPVPREAGAFRPVELISVGLTNRPNIANKPVGANTQPPHPAELDPMKREDLITKLGLRPAEGADGVTDEQIDAAVARLRTAENENGQLSTQLRAANEARDQAERERDEQSARAAGERRARIEDRLTAAANAGRITEAEKAGWRTRLEAGFDGACAALDGLVPAMNTRATQQTGGLGARNGGSVAMTRAARIQAANEAVETRMRETDDADYGRAFAWVRGQKPELFKDMQEPRPEAVRHQLVGTALSRSLDFLEGRSTTTTRTNQGLARSHQDATNTMHGLHSIHSHQPSQVKTNIMHLTALFSPWPRSVFPGSMRRRRHRTGFLAANIAEGTREFDSLVPDAAVPARYLLAKRGSDAAHFAVAGAGDRPIGVCEDQTSTAGVALPGLPLRVNRLGVSTRSKKVAINSAVAQDDLLVPAANGYAQTLPTAAGTYWVIGSAEQAGTASGVAGTRRRRRVHRLPAVQGRRFLTSHFPLTSPIPSDPMLKTLPSPSLARRNPKTGLVNVFAANEREPLYRDISQHPVGTIVAANDDLLVEANFSEPLTAYATGWQRPVGPARRAGFRRADRCR